MSTEVATRAGLWSSVDELLRQSAQFAIAVVLARLLSPHDFGVAAILAFFSQLLIVLVQGGLAAALIRRPNTTAQEESSVFWLIVLAAIGLVPALLCVAPCIAQFYGNPILHDLMPLVAAQVVMSALGSVPAAVLTRRLRFDLLAKAGALSTILSGALGITVAALGAGVWALAIQLIIAATINTASLWAMSNWRPVVGCNWNVTKPIFKFAVWVSLSNAIEFVYAQGIAVYLGKLYGVQELGLYTRAQGTQLIPTNAISSIIGRVALPILSTRLDDPTALKKGLQKAICLAMLINVPIQLGLAVNSDLVLEVVFGPQWLPAAPILSVLALGGTVYPLHVINLQLLLAQGDSRIFFLVEIAKKTLGAVCLVVGSFYGMAGLAYGQLALSVLALWVNTYTTQRTIGYGLVRQFADMYDVWLAAFTMTIAVLFLKAHISYSPALELTFLTTTGILIYAVIGLVLRTQSFQQGAVVLMSIAPPRMVSSLSSVVSYLGRVDGSK